MPKIFPWATKTFLKHPETLHSLRNHWRKSIGFLSPIQKCILRLFTVATQFHNIVSSLLTPAGCNFAFPCYKTLASNVPATSSEWKKSIYPHDVQIFGNLKRVCSDTEHSQSLRVAPVIDYLSQALSTRTWVFLKTWSCPHATAYSRLSGDVKHTPGRVVAIQSLKVSKTTANRQTQWKQQITGKWLNNNNNSHSGAV